MQIILLERIAKLGQMGDIVTVKDGYARNYLLPQGKALRANDTNKERFESQRADLEARNLERKKEADGVNDKLNGSSYVLIRSAGETGQLYGSVSTRDIAAELDENGFKVARSQVSLQNPIKAIGLHSVEIVLHPEVTSTITVNVARSGDEAERQAAGEDLTNPTAAFEAQEADDAEIDLEEIFENPDDAETAAEEIEEAGEEETAEAAEESADEEASDDSDAAEEGEEEAAS
ncbi:MAG: 50S ribosomal protein L9 [Nitratireductor sp.]|nr:50S ribosomal protein L9 [Nitratireductor sp.]